MAVLGVLTCGLSVGLFKASVFGVDPFQCLMAGLDVMIPIGFGTLYVIINALLLVVIFFLDKRYIGIATAVNLFLLGYVVEFSSWVLAVLFGTPSFLLRLVFITVGVVVICFGSAVYFTADLGVSTYDAVSLILADKKMAKFPICRIGCDLICVLAGFLMGAIPGVGTLITAFFMGPLISFFRIKVSEPWLAKYKV